MLVAMKKMQKLHLCLHVISIPSSDFLSYQQNRKGNTSKTWYPKWLPHKTCRDTVLSSTAAQHAAKFSYLLWSIRNSYNSSSSHNANSSRPSVLYFGIISLSKSSYSLKSDLLPSSVKQVLLQVKCNLKYKHFIEFKPP